MACVMLEELPLAQRLALSYAPALAREEILTLLLLDNRLATILRQRSEVLIAQMKLAWWRDRLNEDAADWPSGEPLLERLREGRVRTVRLLPLVDGFEALLTERLDTAVLEEFASGRANAWQSIGEVLAPRHDPEGIAGLARAWAMADLALHMGSQEEAQQVRDLARAERVPARLPRTLRPLGVLHGLSLRALVRGSHDLLDGPGAALLALRIGLLGR